jgi:hypothetical protein
MELLTLPGHKIKHKLKADRNTSIKNDRDGYPYVFVFPKIRKQKIEGGRLG